ncbi:20107_t:CDS:1, partial [Gigaspora rosea]
NHYNWTQKSCKESLKLDEKIEKNEISNIQLHHKQLSSFRENEIFPIIKYKSNSTKRSPTICPVLQNPPSIPIAKGKEGTFSISMGTLNLNPKPLHSSFSLVVIFIV